MVNRVPLNNDNDITWLARRAGIYRGVQAKVAAKLKVSRAQVSYVCRGLRRSPRIEKALAQAVLRIERQQRVAA